MSGMRAYECPVCRRPLMGPDETCGGSFTDRDHPAAVKAVRVICPCGAQCDPGQPLCPSCLEHADAD